MEAARLERPTESEVLGRCSELPIQKGRMDRCTFPQQSGAQPWPPEGFVHC